MHARLAAAAVALAAAVPVRAAAVQVWTASETEKIRPSAAPRAAAQVHVFAARNEWEAFQVVVSGAATGVRATAAELAGPGTIGDVRLHREAIIWLGNPSALDGATGPWPDALVPDVDPLAHERRNAFPFDVPAGESRALWAEVHVPADAAPGDYRGSVHVTFDGGDATVPVTLTVWPFTLPSTASLKSAFGLYYGDLPTAHGVSGDAFAALRARYGAFALDHRVTLSGVDDGDPGLDHVASYYGPALDGAAPTALAGARMTAFQFMGRDAYQDWASAFAARGWTDRLFQYTCDEPPLTCAWGAIPGIAASAHAVSPPLRTLVTTTIQEASDQGVADAVDVLVPVVNYLDDKPGSRWSGDQRGAYDAFLAASPRRELWLYQSCMSHGCGGTVNFGSPSSDDVYFTGWPSYMIDASAVRNRAMEWLSFGFRATGELYWETAYAFGQRGQDAWWNQWDFTGNGDGTLFYPGTPGAIGGATDVPVASIRLKMIREGMEDYEYLKILDDAGDGAFARGVVAALFPHPYATEVAPEALEAAREELAARIVALGLAGAPAGAGTGSGAGTPQPTVKVPGCASGGAGGLLAGLGLALAAAVRRRGASMRHDP